MSNKSEKMMAYGVLVLAACMYGGWALVSKATLASGTAPWMFIFYRCAGGTLALLLVLAAIPSLIPEGKGVELLKQMSRQDLVKFAALGALQLGTAVGFIIASSYVSALMVSIFQPTIPVFTALIAAVTGTEETSPLKIGSVICAVIGAIIVATQGEHSPKGGDSDVTNIMIGTAYLVFSVVSTAVYFVLQKDMMKTYPPFLNTLVAYSFTALFSFPVAVAKHGMDAHAWTMGGSGMAWLGIAYTSGLASAWVLLAWANKATSPTTAAASTAIQPVAAALLQLAIYGTLLTAGQAAGAGAIIGGLFLYVKAMTDQDEAKALLAAAEKPTAEKAV
jgi:drug/metabolite transporter (DMT)-like permease